MISMLAARSNESQMHVGSMKGNASNVFRIWCMVKEGIVTNKDGKQWKQVGVPDEESV